MSRFPAAGEVVPWRRNRARRGASPTGAERLRPGVVSRNWPTIGPSAASEWLTIDRRSLVTAISRRQTKAADDDNRGILASLGLPRHEALLGSRARHADAGSWRQVRFPPDHGQDASEAESMGRRFVPQYSIEDSMSVPVCRYCPHRPRSLPGFMTPPPLPPPPFPVGAYPLCDFCMRLVASDWFSCKKSYGVYTWVLVAMRFNNRSHLHKGGVSWEYTHPLRWRNVFLHHGAKIDSPLA